MQALSPSNTLASFSATSCDAWLAPQPRLADARCVAYGAQACSRRVRNGGAALRLPTIDAAGIRIL